MRRLLLIVSFTFFSSWAFAQDDIRVIDSLENSIAQQKGRKRIETMMKLSLSFVEVSFDDGIEWGEKALSEARNQGFDDLEADANYTLGIQYGDHADLDLASVFLKKAYDMHLSIANEEKAFEDIWKQAYFEQVFGNVDTALCLYNKGFALAERRNDTLGMAKVNSNIAILQYQKHEYSQAEAAFKKARKGFALLNDSVMMARMDANMATLYMEWGKMTEAKRLFQSVLVQFEAEENYGMLLYVYKNYGQFFVKDKLNFDSAYYYYEKAYSLLVFLEENGVDVPVSNKVDVLVEMGNVQYSLDKPKEALEPFHEAYEMAESSNYYSGQMMACIGLASVYSQLAQASKSQHYINKFFELESSSGITLAHSVMRYPLIVNYARLGRFGDMESEINNLKDDYNGIMRENDDLFEQNQNLQQINNELLVDRETQSLQMLVLQTQRNHYRLAFFGLLSIVIFTVVLLIAYKIVRKNRTKSVKP